MGAEGPQAKIRIGVAGWDYADWDGSVYPARKPAGFDRLAYLAGFVDLVEINSTFYRPVAARTALSWLRRTRGFPRFRFSAKAHRSWTHEADADLEHEVPHTLEGLAPLREAGRLGALLLQFPQSFHLGAPAWERLERLAGQAAGWPLVVEVRHASWGAPQVARRMQALGLGWCAVDQPVVGRSTLGLVARVQGPVGYLRLHGRNAADWFREDAGRDARYDYLYAEPQIEELARQARNMARAAAEVFVVQNNHFRGQALVNALQLRSLVEGRRVAAPRQLVASYPALSASTLPEPDRLF